MAKRSLLLFSLLLVSAWAWTASQSISSKADALSKLLALKEYSKKKDKIISSQERLLEELESQLSSLLRSQQLLETQLQTIEEAWMMREQYFSQRETSLTHLSHGFKAFQIDTILIAGGAGIIVGLAIAGILALIF